MSKYPASIASYDILLGTVQAEWLGYEWDAWRVLI